MPLECRELEKTFLHAYVDGEFSADESAEMKAHLAGCAICAETVRVQQSYKVAAGRANVAAPHQLHDAVRGSLAAEPYRGRWARALREPRAVAVAAATVGAAAWFLAGGLQHPIFRGGHSIVDDGVALHARALPLDYTASDVSSAQRWLSEKLDFGVRLPRFSQGPRLEGVRLSQVRSRQAAVVTYTRAAAAGGCPAHRRSAGLALPRARLQHRLLAQRRDRLFADQRSRRRGRSRTGAVGRAAIARVPHHTRGISRRFVDTPRAAPVSF